MDRTPKISKYSNKSSFSTANEIQRTPASSTKMFSQLDNDDSPIASTQEGCDNIDVVWDWNSPQPKPRKSKKRLILSQSPKALKRHSSNNNIQNFEKLREELQSLREAIAVPDNEESLVLSPLEEAEYKSIHNPAINDIPPPPSTQEIYLEGNDDDLFNDSADEYLLLCTQRIEADLEHKEKNAKGHNNNFKTKTSNDTNVNTYSGFNNSNFKPILKFESEIKDVNNIPKKTNIQERNDFIDNSFNNNQVAKNPTYFKFNRTKSENRFQYSKQGGKVEFHRTQSFESTVECTKEVIPQHKLDEIERNRKEALAKLESKRKQENNSTFKCSPEEIEQKRLQALAKLEAKRLQETIEHKRQEALKRRELSRKKNAVVVKSSLSKRL